MAFSPPDNILVAVIGLGYVGLPLSLAFGRAYPVVAYDHNAHRIAQLHEGWDAHGEYSKADMAAVQVHFTADAVHLRTCNVFVLAIPTPVTPAHEPDWRQLEEALGTVAQYLKKGDVVIVESTVYPGATEERLMPLLEKHSGLSFNRDFFAGYSPERINPGDTVHRLETIVKITSGSTPEVAAFVDALYRKIIQAGTHKASSIRVAEAAKAIENAQRDINIAFVNELAVMFSKMGIDTQEVLEAAGTKWNFLPFKPGLVGGHCIGVDPYYLAHRAIQAGHHPEIILAGRKINDAMPAFVAGQVAYLLGKKNIPLQGARALVLGIAFKENCADVRNSGAAELVKCLQHFGITVDVYDPLVSAEAVWVHYGIHMAATPTPAAYEAIVLAVGHDIFSSLDIAACKKLPGVVYDIRHFLPKADVDGRL